jgi:hypothetical protein
MLLYQVLKQCHDLKLVLRALAGELPDDAA